ncbi:type VII secretion-associated serine protease mycosin [Nonomuraea typhae]|uniref:type VII secretion-associated serine protease mycosin n=1 Tax=Nonomuraea typhae TaxID=2603600 RepID=UPI0012F88049|nr:type VII secretion-associated serine protease mycosin [Nonomuraea typhae]
MIGRVLAAGGLAVACTLWPVAAHAAPPECAPERGKVTISSNLWAQQRLDIRSAWRLTAGKGVTVAVIDSGVDVKHPQLKIAGKADFSRTTSRDCEGHGTAVAGIIGAQFRNDFPFYGVAPQSRLLALKHANGKRGDVAHLVEAIQYAAKIGVDVINISAQAADQPDLKAAIDYALAQDVVVVAAAGNADKSDGTPGPAYPAAYEGVLSVGALAPDGRISDFSNTGSKVSVVAPGQGLTSTWPGGTYKTDLPGTSFAAPYVAGVAALVRARFPDLNQEQVRRRIEATADGGLGTGTGTGTVNPVAAVSTILPAEEVVVAPPRPEPLPPGVVAKRPEPDERAITVAVWVGAGALVLAGALVAARVVMPMGRRRGWRPGS